MFKRDSSKEIRCRERIGDDWKARKRVAEIGQERTIPNTSKLARPICVSSGRESYIAESIALLGQSIVVPICAGEMVHQILVNVLWQQDACSVFPLNSAPEANSGRTALNRDKN